MPVNNSALKLDSTW